MVLQTSNVPRSEMPVETVGNKVGDNIEPGGVTIRGVERSKVRLPKARWRVIWGPIDADI